MPLEPLSVDLDLRAAPGWFGKISTLGDFAQRRLPIEFVRACDAWLSGLLVGSRERLGERWLEAYLTARLWRFAWAPGVVGPDWWFGVLMPSCDKVGRYFPLLVAQRRTGPPLDRAALDHLDAWFGHLASAAAATLAEAETTERFERALAAAPAWPAAVGRYANAPADPDGQASFLRSLDGAAASGLRARLRGCSVWWRRDDADQGESVQVVTGLPDADRFARMLTGDA